MANIKLTQVIDGVAVNTIIVDEDNIPNWLPKGYVKEADIVLRDKTQAEIDIEVSQEAERDAIRVQQIKKCIDSPSDVSRVLIKISFLQENRLRVLEGKKEITMKQFRTWVDGQIE